MVCKGVEKSQQAHFMDVKGCEAQSSIFIEIALYVSIIIIIITIIIIIIITIKKGKGLGLGVESPCIKLCWVPPTPARSKTHE